MNSLTRSLWVELLKAVACSNCCGVRRCSEVMSGAGFVLFRSDRGASAPQGKWYLFRIRRGTILLYYRGAIASVRIRVLLIGGEQNPLSLYKKLSYV